MAEGTKGIIVAGIDQGNTEPNFSKSAESPMIQESSMPTAKSLTDSYKKNVRPLVAQLFKTMKLDRVYTRAEGDHLWSLGDEKPILDFLGGYGVNIVGHNHPRLLNASEEFFRSQTPMFAQASVRKSAALFAEKINSVIQKENKIQDSYVVTLTNSGAESVEAALKHALIHWKNKKEHRLLDEKRKALQFSEMDHGGFFEIQRLEPVFLSVKNSFHGKTSGAVSVTWNQEFRSMYYKSPLNIEFIDHEDSFDTITALVKKHSCGNFVGVAGVIFEPIQCEGGMNPLPENLIKSFVRLQDEFGIPLIVDEIQTGLYRTGRFLASSSFVKKPDYILLGKGLGGGLSKCGAVLVRKPIYCEEFGVIHTSTFAEDEFSAQMAIETLSILEDHKSDIEERADYFEKTVRSHIQSLAQRYPEVIKQVRGEGFLIGVEFDVEENKKLSPLIDGIYQCGMISYVFASYLLHQFQVRVGVTLSKPNVLRIQPSFFVTDESIKQLLKGLQSLVELLVERKLLKMTSHFWEQPLADELLETPSDPYTRDFIRNNDDDKEIYKVGFLTHVVNERQLMTMDPLFRHISKKDRNKFLSKFAPVASPMRYHTQVVRDDQGNKIELSLYGVFLPSTYFMKSHRDRSVDAYNVVRQMCHFAEADGCGTIGLGQFTSIVTDSGTLLREEFPNVKITTGNNLTIGSAVLSIERVLKELNKTLTDVKIAILGAPGNIGSTLSVYLSTKVSELYLYYYQDVKESCKFQSVVDEIQQTSPRCCVQAFSDIELLRECDVLVVCTNSTDFVIPSESLKQNAVVLDLSVPSNISPKVVQQRKDVTFYEGGFMKFPFQQKIESRWVPAAKTTIFACMAESVLLGLHRSPRSMHSIGRVDPALVDPMLELAKDSGVTLGAFKGRR